MFLYTKKLKTAAKRRTYGFDTHKINVQDCIAAVQLLVGIKPTLNEKKTSSPPNPLTCFNFEIDGIFLHVKIGDGVTSYEIWFLVCSSSFLFSIWVVSLFFSLRKTKTKWHFTVFFMIRLLCPRLCVKEKSGYLNWEGGGVCRQLGNVAQYM